MPIVILHPLELRKNACEMDFDSLLLSRQQLDAFPNNFLNNIERTQRGDFSGLVTMDENGTTMCAFVWMDRDRRYFISTTGSIEAGTPYVRYRWMASG